MNGMQMLWVNEKESKLNLIFLLLLFLLGSVFPQEIVKGDWIGRLNTLLGGNMSRLSRAVC